MQELEKLAELLADSLAGGEVILCQGDLGSGKTSLAKLLFKKLGVKENITSPTFNIQLQYQSDRGVCSHIDLYRVETLEEVDELGLFEQMGENILFIEWPEIIASEIIDPDFKIVINSDDVDCRIFTITTNKWGAKDYEIDKGIILKMLDNG